MSERGFVMYPDDFLGSLLIQSMSAAQVGAYILLMLYSFSDGLPDDDVLLAKVSKLGKRWPKNREIILSRFVKGDDGRLHHRRMLKDKQQREAYRRQQAEHGRRGAAKKWASKTENGPKSDREGPELAGQTVKQKSPFSGPPPDLNPCKQTTGLWGTPPKPHRGENGVGMATEPNLLLKKRGPHPGGPRASSSSECDRDSPNGSHADPGFEVGPTAGRPVALGGAPSVRRSPPHGDDDNPYPRLPPPPDEP